jgi:hypothetical protein
MPVAIAADAMECGGDGFGLRAHGLPIAAGAADFHWN